VTRSLICVACTLGSLAAAVSARASRPSFFARRDYALGAYGIAVADTNGDGVPDVITAVNDQIKVLLGNGDGTFRQGPASQVGMGTAFSPVPIDLNGDGKVDLVFSTGIADGPSGIAVCFGNGDGTFQPAVFYQGGTDQSPGNAVLGDFNGDGIPDALSTGESGIWFFAGKGGGVFATGVLTPMAEPDGGVVATADFNGGGKLDLAITTPTGFVVLLGNGDGTFQPPQAYTTTPLSGSWISIGDLNLDGHPDIVLAAYGSDYAPDFVLVYLGNGAGGFAGPTKAEISPVEQIAIGDVNGDHIPDLVGSEGYIALGNGDGTFRKPVSYPLPSGITKTSVALADLRRGGLTDLAFQDADGTVSVLLNLGQGKFEDGEWMAIQGGAGCGAAADYNGDGHPDLAVNTPTGVSILLGTGRVLHPFEYGATLALPDAGCLITGDLNGDGIPDLLVPSNGTVVAYLGNGDGTFTQKSTTATPTGGFLALGDFNHDGKLDFATSGNLLALGNGDGTFQAPVQMIPDLAANNIAAGDLKGDGWTDLVLTLTEDSYIYVLRNNRHGGFTKTAIHAVDGRFLINPGQVALADLNGDGKLDIVVAASAGGGAFVYMADASGAYTYQTEIYSANVTLGATVIAISDLNGDGIPDLVMSQGGGGSTLGIFLGKGDGTFANPYYIGAGPFPGDIVIENLHGQSPCGHFRDIAVPDMTGGVMVLVNNKGISCPGL
jgi:VCBS repeat protein